MVLNLGNKFSEHIENTTHDHSTFSSFISFLFAHIILRRYMQLHFIREGDGYAEAYFARYLIEDR